MKIKKILPIYKTIDKESGADTDNISKTVIYFLIEKTKI